MKYLLLILLTLSTAAQAELEEWYKKAIKVPSPNELSLFSFVSRDCKAMTGAELRSIAEGVLIRSRIKPLPVNEHVNNSTKYPIFLEVSLDCFDKTPYQFDLDIEFGKAEPGAVLLFSRSYGAFGRYGTERMKAAVKEEVENAITDYVKVNFNL